MRFEQLSSTPQYHGNMRVGRDVVEDQKFESWLIHLPQVLWEIGSSNLLSTEVGGDQLLLMKDRTDKVYIDGASRASAYLAAAIEASPR